MRIPKVTIIIVVLMWVLTLIASYQFGSRSERLRLLTEGNGSNPLQISNSDQTASDKSDPGPAEGKSAKNVVSKDHGSGDQMAEGRNARREDGSRQQKRQSPVVQQSEEDIIANLYDQLQEAPEGTQKRNLFFSYVSRLAKSDPAAAIEFASQWENYSDRESGIVKVLTNWGRKDPETAWNWILENNDNPQLVYNRIQSMLKGAVIKNPETAFALALEIDDKNMQANAIGQLARSLLRSNKYDTIISQLNTLPEGNSRDRFVSQIAYDWGQKDPQATSEWINGLETGSEKNQATLRLSEAWGRRNPPEAADWALSLGDSNLRQQSLQRVVNSWMQYDISATANWLNQHPPSADLDLAVVTFVSRVRRDDPEGARSWAETITNPNLRQQQLDLIDGNKPGQ